MSTLYIPNLGSNEHLGSVLSGRLPSVTTSSSHRLCAALLLAARMLQVMLRILRNQPAPVSHRAVETALQGVCRICQSDSTKDSLRLPPVAGFWLSPSILLLCHVTEHRFTVSSGGLTGVT